MENGLVLLTLSTLMYIPEVRSDSCTQNYSDPLCIAFLIEMFICNHCACNTDWLACAWAEFKAACINDVTKIWTFFTSSILSLTYALRLMSCCHEMSYSPSPSLCDVIYEWPLMSKHLGFGPLWGYLNHVLPSGLRSKLDFEGIKFSARIVGRDSTLLLQGC